MALVDFPLVGFVKRILDRWIVLRSAERMAEAVPAARRERVAEVALAGDNRWDAALGERGVAGLILARSAIPCFLEAIVTARGDEPPPPGAGVALLWDLYETVAARGAAPRVPLKLEPTRELTRGAQTPEQEISEHGERRIDETLALGRFLSGVIETRTPRRIRVERWLRTFAFVAFSLFAGERIVARIFWPPNLILHGPAAGSSRRPGSGPVQDLTNGVIEKGTAFATRDEPDPWVMFDVIVPHRMSEVKVFPGDDHHDDAFPLRVETSPDSLTWEPGALQTKHAGPTQPIVIPFPARTTRFIRIHGKGPGALYLNEVEVR